MSGTFVQAVFAKFEEDAPRDLTDILDGVITDPGSVDEVQIFDRALPQGL